MNEVPKIEILKPIMANGLALSLFANFGEERVRGETVPPAKLVVVDIESDGGGDWLTREAGGAGWFRSLTTLRTLSMDSEASSKDMMIVWQLLVLVGVAEWWNDGDLPTNEQSLYVPHFGTTILHHSHHTHNPSLPTPISTAPICAHVHSMALINPW